MDRSKTILRDDDIYLSNSPRYGTLYYNFNEFVEVHEMIADAGFKHTLAIIASEIDKYPELTEYIKRHLSECNLEVHGWEHADYSKWVNKADITTDMLKAEVKIKKTFGVEPTMFFPPWNRYSDIMKAGVEDSGLKFMGDYVQFPQTGDVICFHYWNLEERNMLKEWLNQS